MPTPVSDCCANLRRVCHASRENHPGQVMLSGLGTGIARIGNLQFPFPIRIDVETGACELLMRRFTRTLRSGQARVVPPLEELSLTLLHRATLTLAIVPQSETCALPSGRCRGNESLHLEADDLRQRRPATAGIALAVFTAPHHDWGLSSAAAWLGMPDRRWLSRKLLQECSSLRQLVRTQRLSRFLFDLLSSAPLCSAARYGFADQCGLENAVYDQFGISVAALSRLSSVGHEGSVVSFAYRVAEKIELDASECHALA
ncbi:hypothetical protein [Cupriavidus sp. DF5525]|uniref:hypothetical protein n=1 Tax=Cupriavidus sp. DF5525 TaxID=3160989 RepID=UPI0003B0298C|nr:hypothetical protein N234_09105 [Ralstonia pickettii DTP0602]